MPTYYVMCHQDVRTIVKIDADDAATAEEIAEARVKAAGLDVPPNYDYYFVEAIVLDLNVYTDSLVLNGNINPVDEGPT